MSRPVHLLVEDILERIHRIQRAVQGMDHVAFLGDEKTIDAVVRSLEVIGEAASRLPAEFQERHDEVPWRHPR